MNNCEKIVVKCNQSGLKCCPFYKYCNNPKCWDRHTWTKSVDPDQTLQNMASDLHQYALSTFIQQYEM